MMGMHVATAIQNVLTAYGMGGWKDIRRCGCDLDEASGLLRVELENEEKTITNESIAKQKAAWNSFKNGDIDTNSALYKNIIAKYEYKINLGIFQYTSNEYFSTGKALLAGSIGPLAGSLSVSLYQNNISGKGSASADVAFGGKVGSVKVMSKFGLTIDYVQGKNGNYYPRDLDLRAGLEASAGSGPVKATAGISASIQDGTKIYGKLTLTGNGYLDKMKKKEFGAKDENPELVMVSNVLIHKLTELDVWNGEYVFK